MTNEVSRRRAVGIGASVGLTVLVDSMLQGCKTRGYNTVKSTPAGARAAKPLTDFAKEFLDPSKPFLALYDSIAADTSAYDDPIVPGPGGAPLTLAEDFQGGAPKQQALLKFLILVRIKVAPTFVFDEMLAAGRKILNPSTLPKAAGMRVAAPGSLAPILVASHAGVVGQILNPDNVTTLTEQHPADALLIPAGTKVNTFRLMPYHPEMPFLVGHFMLCDDDVVRHDMEKKIVQDASFPKAHEESAKFSAIVRKHADELMSAAMAKDAYRDRKEIDLVQDLARWLPIRVVQDYFGVPSGPSAPAFKIENDREAKLFGKAVGDEIKPSQEQMYIWIANSFRNLFLNLGKDQTIAKYGRRSGSQLMWYLYKLVKLEAAAQAPGGKPTGRADTSLGRLVTAWKKNAGTTNDMFAPSNNQNTFDQQGNAEWLGDLVTGPEYRVAAQMAGAVAGAGVTVEEAIARVFNVLLSSKNTNALAGAIAAAKALDGSAAGKDAAKYRALRAYYKEALRFQPQAELLPRIAAADATVDGESIPKGALVFASLYGAMHDKAHLEKAGGKPAGEFHIGRAEDCYLEFGWQRNKCLGQYIAPLEIVEAMRAVLSKATGGLEKVGELAFGPDAPWEDNGDLGKLDFAGAKGPFMHSLVVRYV